jgi:hypothetical protein
MADLVPPDLEALDDELPDGLFLAVLLVGGAWPSEAAYHELAALAGPKRRDLPIDAS